MKSKSIIYAIAALLFMACMLAFAIPTRIHHAERKLPSYHLLPAEKVFFNSFVDCNMAEAWVGDSFRIFPGKYGEDPVWGNARELKFADGRNAKEAFGQSAASFSEPLMPINVKPGERGLHGAVWFETVYQDSKDATGKTLFAVYHNENYPSTLPFDPATGEGYINKNWPQGLRGPETATAVCRIGIMKSTDGGRSWDNKGIFIEDLQPRLILKPDNTSINFAGGVGDPSAVASGNYLYLFFSEYGYAGNYDHAHYDPWTQFRGQCISVARIKLSDLDDPVGKARRWDGKGFNAEYNGVGKPISSLQIPIGEGGGPASSPTGKYYWGPSVSWNTSLNSWIMLMAKAERPSWKGNSIFISFNKNRDLGLSDNSQAWSKPEMLVKKLDHILWYPSLQPGDSKADVESKFTSLKLGKLARIYYKDMFEDSSAYLSEYRIEFGN